MTRLLTLIALATLLAACTAPAPPLAARYCYRTLAEVDCHAQPLAGEASRQVGFFDQAALN